MRILIRADDLGYSEAVNYGIEKSCRDGIVKSVGIMPNMTAAKHGYDLIKDLDLCLGLHANVCVGNPLTDSKRIPSLTQENGMFKSSKMYRDSDEDFVKLEEVILEIEAQYRMFVYLTGDKPHYFEGHAIASDTFNKGLELVAEKHNCPYLPAPKGNRPVKFKNSLVRFAMDSMDSEYDPFTSLKKFAMCNHKDKSIEMLVFHPGYLDDYILKTSSLTIPRTKEVEMLCSEETKQWLIDNEVEVISYDDLD